MTRRSLVLLLTLATLAVASGAPAALITLNTPAPDAPVPAPRFEGDPAWPKPLPNRWIMGQAAGVAVDRQDHVWVIQRPRTRAPASPVIELDGDGNLVQAWGGPGQAYAWPASEHGIYVDHQNNVWLASSPSAPRTSWATTPTRGTSTAPPTWWWIHRRTSCTWPTATATIA